MCEAGAADGGHPCSCDPVTSGHLQRGPAVFSQASRNGSHLVEMGRATWAGKTPPRWEGSGAKVPREEPPPSGWSSSGPSSAPHTRPSLHHSRPRSRSRSRWLSSCSDGAKCRREASHLRERPAAEKPGAQTHDEGGEGGGQDGTVERRSVVRAWAGAGQRDIKTWGATDRLARWTKGANFDPSPSEATPPCGGAAPFRQCQVPTPTHGLLRVAGPCACPLQQAHLWAIPETKACCRVTLARRWVPPASAGGVEPGLASLDVLPDVLGSHKALHPPLQPEPGCRVTRPSKAPRQGHEASSVTLGARLKDQAEQRWLRVSLESPMRDRRGLPT